jgi:hypothetical protein
VESILGAAGPISGFVERYPEQATRERCEGWLGEPDNLPAVSETASSSMEPAPELVSLMERMFRNWDALDANGMVDALFRHPGSLAIGTDPDE